MNKNQLGAKNELIKILSNQRQTEKYSLAYTLDSIRGCNSFLTHSLDIYKRSKLLEMLNVYLNCNDTGYTYIRYDYAKIIASGY